MIIFTSIYFLFSLCFFLLFNKFSSILNIYDIPNERKLHEKKTSLAGGVYVFICIFTYFFFCNSIQQK